MVSAERGVVTLKKQNDQRFHATMVRLDPYSAENEALLEELGIELQPVDPIWQDEDFAEFLALMKEADRLETEGDLVNAMYTLFAAIDLMDEINHRELTLLPEEREFFDRLRSAIDENPFAFEADPEYFLVEQVLVIWGEELEKAFEEYEENLGVNEIYAYADPGGYAYPEETVYLRLSTTAPEGLDVSWRQTYGPNVQWLATSSNLESAFIVPQGSEGESLIFEYTITRLGQTKTGRVDLQVFDNPLSTFVAPDDAITHLYHSLLARDPDPDGYVYWKQQYDSGMSLDEIAQTFMQSDEYQQLHR